MCHREFKKDEEYIKIIAFSNHFHFGLMSELSILESHDLSATGLPDMVGAKAINSAAP